MGLLSYPKLISDFFIKQNDIIFEKKIVNMLIKLDF